MTAGRIDHPSLRAAAYWCLLAPFALGLLLAEFGRSYVALTLPWSFILLWIMFVGVGAYYGHLAWTRFLPRPARWPVLAAVVIVAGSISAAYGPIAGGSVLLGGSAFLSWALCWASVTTLALWPEVPSRRWWLLPLACAAPPAALMTAAAGWGIYILVTVPTGELPRGFFGLTVAMTCVGVVILLLAAVIDAWGQRAAVRRLAE